MTGHVELTDQVEVPAPIQGQLVAVVVEPGDEVEEGELLAEERLLGKPFTLSGLPVGRARVNFVAQHDRFREVRITTRDVDVTAGPGAPVKLNRLSLQPER